MLQVLREQVWKLHLELPKSGLVTWTGGNVSARDPETGLVVIKPSGVKYEDLRPEHLVILDVDGNIVEGGGTPDPDTVHVTVSVSWDFTPSRHETLDISAYLTRWQDPL